MVRGIGKPPATAASSTTGTPYSWAPPGPSHSTSPWLESLVATHRQNRKQLRGYAPARRLGGTGASTAQDSIGVSPVGASTRAMDLETAGVDGEPTCRRDSVQL